MHAAQRTAGGETETVSVAIFGGGVAGMTVAHELACRSGTFVGDLERIFRRRAGRAAAGDGGARKRVVFDIQIYEAKSMLGGKAASYGRPHTGDDRDLPCEHGFHFFPGFYRHLEDTIGRIPATGGAPDDTVADHLIPGSWAWTAMGRPPLELRPHFPRGLRDVLAYGRGLRRFFELGLTVGDLRHFVERVWLLATSSEQRRREELDKISWWDFLQAGQRSPQFQKYLAEAPVVDYIACHAKEASARTVGEIGIQLVYAIAQPWSGGGSRVLDAPMHEALIGPWRRELQRLGVTFRTEHRLESLEVHGGRVTGAQVRSGSGQLHEVDADHYVVALPLEVAEPILNAPTGGSPRRSDPSFRTLELLKETLGWMVGLQFYLPEPHPICPGHVTYVDSALALTSISQAQFWRTLRWQDYGTGAMRELISVIVSNWSELTEGSHPTRRRLKATWTKGREPVASVKQRIAREVLSQINANLPSSLRIPPDQAMAVWDPHVAFTAEDDGVMVTNQSPLLTNQVNTWGMRPNAATTVAQLTLAGDWVRTNTDLCCVEGANESGRRAAIVVLNDLAYPESLPRLYPMHRPPALFPFRWLDDQLLDQGISRDRGFRPVNVVRALVGALRNAWL